MWNQRETLLESENRPHNDSAYQKYLVSYGKSYRLKLKPGWTQEAWFELVSEDPSTTEGYHAFNMVVRETERSQVDYTPMHDELGRELLMCVNDANVALSYPLEVHYVREILVPQWRSLGIGSTRWQLRFLAMVLSQWT